MEEKELRATGIIRRMDELGRVVIPKEIRRTLHIKEGETMEIFVEQDDQIILRKYSSLREKDGQIQNIAESLAQVTGFTVCICNTDQMIASAGARKGMFAKKSITGALWETLQRRESYIARRGERKYIKIAEGQEDLFSSQLICPILCDGDVAGGVILLAKESSKKMEDSEKKVTAYVAAFLGKQMA